MAAAAEVAVYFPAEVDRGAVLAVEAAGDWPVVAAAVRIIRLRSAADLPVP